MKFGGIELSSGAFGGLDIVNKSAAQLPQDVATAVATINDDIVGVTYTPIWYIGKQLVNGMKYMFVMEQTRATREINKRIVVVTFVVPPVQSDGTQPPIDIKRVDSEVILPEEVALAFDTVTKQLLGVNYRPIAFVGKQLVSKSVNYHVLCSARPVYPGAQPYGVEMVINDYNGKASLVSIETLA